MINRILPKITDKVLMPENETLVGYVNIFNYLSWRKHPDLVQGFDHFTLDGIMLAVFLKVFYRKSFERMSPDFSSYFQELFETLESEQRPVYFVGGTESEVETAVSVFKESFPDLVVAGYHSGYYKDDGPILQEVIDSGAEVCIVGMGTPRQERFLVNLKDRGFGGRGFSCGAFISQTAQGGKVYYPSWVNTFHLRWLYRIYREPKLFTRYTVDYPKGLYHLIRDKYGSR